MSRPRYYYIQKAILEKDCNKFVDEYKNKDLEDGMNYFISRIDREGLKDCKHQLAWVPPADIMMRALWSYIIEANNNLFHLNISNIPKYAGQFTKYSEINDGYNWHIDMANNDDEDDELYKKLTCVIQLSKPEDYEGGEFQLYNGENKPDDIPIKEQGSIIVYRSNEWHRITPLIKGTRYSLVYWAVGPRLI